MTWSYARNGLYISHQLRATAEGRLELLTVDFDGYATAEPVPDEYAGIAKQMKLERRLRQRGWALEDFVSPRRPAEHAAA